MNKLFNQISANKITVYSGIATLITSIGYLLEKMSLVKINFPFGILLFPSLAILIVFGIMVIYLSVERFQIEDINAIYSIKILNSEGDAKINRRITFSVNNGSINNREHNTYSDGALVSASEFALKAWDLSGNELSCEMLIDKPSYKKYKVHFPHTLSEGDEFTYEDEYNWKKVFNVATDYWFLSDSSKEIEVNLIISRNWHLLYISAEEAYADGTKKEMSIKLKDKVIENSNYVKHTYFLKKRQRHARVKLEWNINQNFVPIDIV